MPDLVRPNDSTMRVDLSGQPLSEVSFDDLFPSEGTEPQPVQPVAASVQPVAQPVQQDFFLKASSGTVYKTREDAERGTAEKDRLLEKLRQHVIEREGVDPLTGQPVQRTVPQEQVNYATDPERFTKDMSEAIRKNDSRGFHKVFDKLIDDKFAPYGPALTGMSKANAVEMVGTEIKTFRDFRVSDDYRNTIEFLPDLKRAVETAENDPRFAGQLPELYKIVFYAAQGRKSLSGASQPQTLVPVTLVQTAQPRPTLTPQTLAPDNTGARSMTSEEMLANPEARKAYIKQVQSTNSGVLDQKF